MINILYAAYGPQGGAGTQGQGGGNPMSLIFMIIAIFAVMYFLMIRPQQRQKRQHQDMLSKVSKGDKVVTTGGLHGTVAGVKDTTLILKVADNVKVEVNRSSVSQIVSSKSTKAQTQSQAKKTEENDEESSS
jgi:preprotein translocase subunit YajC